MNIQTLYILFGAIFVIYLILDLAVFNRKTHEPNMRTVVIQTIVAVMLAVIFALALWLFGYTREAIDFTTVYVTEKMLSLDNLFVMLVIFQFFNIEKRYQHKVLFWGILGAIVFRLVFIAFGATLVSSFSWLLYLFAAFLIWTGYKVIQQAKGGDDTHDLENHKVNRLLHRYIPFTAGEHYGKFFAKVNGKKVVTYMFFALIMIEMSDIIFALDSIPAAFAITTNAPIIFTANIVAILGLRSLFFIIEWLLEKLTYLSYGLGAVLIFIGLKFILHSLVHISSGLSLVIIALLLGGAALWSFVKK